mmetsp:Transcript_42920/g.121447  ORF Transcript_42920/g.121447 Transcript_42920/m.121447 type:complete len:244 (+) Transcript_42920:765-1496(+)
MRPPQSQIRSDWSMFSPPQATMWASYPSVSHHHRRLIASSPPLMSGTSRPGLCSQVKSAFQRTKQAFPFDPFGISFHVSGSRDVIVGTTTVRWSPLRFIWRRNASSHPGRGLTWQSKNTITSPTAASPPVFFAPMRPMVRSCRMILTDGLPGLAWRSFSGNSPRRGGRLPSSTTRISRSRLDLVRSRSASTVLTANFPSKAHGSTTLRVSSFTEDAFAAGSGGSASVCSASVCSWRRLTLLLG